MTFWFGDPWPAADRRAPVCDNDNERVPTPAGIQCLFCHVPISHGDRGVLIGMIRGQAATAEPSHLQCLLDQTVGPSVRDLIDTHESAATTGLDQG